jgi:sugar lactone lactonase YvrE
MVQVLYRSSCELGESPVWHQERNSCFWVDVEAGTLYEYSWNKKSVVKYQIEHRVSVIIPSGMETLVLGLQGGIAEFDLLTKRLTWLSSPAVNWDDFRCNDGGADPSGRVWMSTMELSHKQDAGAIYCLNNTGMIAEKISDISIPNGIVWSADHKRMYYTDSEKAEIYSVLYNDGTAEVALEKIAVHIPGELGLPDGMAMDEEGMLWVALWGGYGVGRFDLQTGKMTDFINIPAPHVTSCCFAGKDLNDLIITTARSGMSKEALEEYPESGNIFIAKMNVKGISSQYADV